MKTKLIDDLNKLLPQMKTLAKEINKLENGDWHEYFDRNDPDEMFRLNTVFKVGDNLRTAYRALENMNASIIGQGTLYRNDKGRYEYAPGHYYNSGSPIEFLYQDDDGEATWIASSVEHNQTDYYIVSHPKLDMNGLQVRERARSPWGD